jgi:hypothetical protein
MSLKDSFLSSFKWAAESQAKTYQIYNVADELGLLDVPDDDYYADFSIYGDTPYIRLAFFDRNAISVAFEHVVTESAQLMATKAKELLPKVGEFGKRFSNTDNRLQLVASYKGVEIILEAKPPHTCTVETVTEEVEVPEQVIPARKETRTRYVLKGDCDPLMKSTEVATQTISGPVNEVFKTSADSSDSNTVTITSGTIAVQEASNE